MKIISYQKAEKQARAYADSKFDDMSPEWHEAYRLANEEHEKISAIYRKEITSKCESKRGENESQCFCKSFPRYPELASLLEAATQKVNAIYAEKANRYKQIYANELTRILSGVEAKKKYSKTQK